MEMQAKNHAPHFFATTFAIEEEREIAPAAAELSAKTVAVVDMFITFLAAVVHWKFLI